MARARERFCEITRIGRELSLCEKKGIRRIKGRKVQFEGSVWMRVKGRFEKDSR